MKEAYINWSSGKDAALALYKIQQSKAYHISKLVTTINTDFNRVSMHGLRTELLEQQTKSIGLPLKTIAFKNQVSMKTYDAIMGNAVHELKSEGYTHSIFGDIFLEDLRKYREDKLKEIGVVGVFPLWKKDTRLLLKEFLQLGFKAITVCVNAKLLDASFCGRIIDEDFLNDLPPTVDPCGENGEFHTFVFDGPIFKNPINFSIGEKIKRNYTPNSDGDDCYDKNDVSWDTSFWYCDLLSK